MREMVLNHASVVMSERGRVDQQLIDLARGMGELTHRSVAHKSLRMAKGLAEIECLSGESLHSIFLGLRRKERDAHAFLMGLAQKVPIDAGLDIQARNRLLACESMSMDATDASPLLVCAINDSIAVGLPSEPLWDRDRLHVEFEELLDSGDIEPDEAYVDQLSRSSHATAIIKRHQHGLRTSAALEEVWASRGELFSALLFGMEVEQHLMQNANHIRPIVRKLAELDRSAAEWAHDQAPSWRSKVTPESASVMNTPKLRKARQFKSASGVVQGFYLHARVGSGIRIHLRIDASTRQVEIGYIGQHLPL